VVADVADVALAGSGSGSGSTEAALAPGGNDADATWVASDAGGVATFAVDATSPHVVSPMATTATPIA